MMARTVLGDVAPGELGAISCHEHLIIDSPFVAEHFPHIHLASVEDAVTELAPWRRAGLGTVVDAMPAGQGRDIDRLAEISRRSAVHVVATTGLHTAKYYLDVPWALDPDPDDLVERFSVDIDHGADGTAHRCGVIKVATGPEGVDDRARRVFAAAAETHRRTGAPLLTHCEEGRHAIEQVRLLDTLGVPLDRVVLSHTDKVVDVGYHTELLGSGVNLEYDQALRQPPDEPKGSAWLMGRMIAAGFGAQLMLGTDGARRTLWTALGGTPGLAWLFTGYAEVLATYGIHQGILDSILVDNPARWLTFGYSRPPGTEPSR